MEYLDVKKFRSKIWTGVDAKLLHYESNAKNIVEKQIDLQKLIETFLFKGEHLSHNCVMINLEKDVERYRNASNELKKLSFEKFVHLKGTYWKEKETLQNDLTFIIEFLKIFNPGIESKRITINEFSEINDPNVKIQDGPLGCYCSHLRALIYGYLNFEKYTIIIEDDISITNTENIEKYLKCIPDDWDIVFFGSIGKNKYYHEPYYRFDDDFHSTHFYIVNHKCLETLFKKMYPVNDQVDVLISDLHHYLNMYNISDTVYQRDISTNTQNNLHTIFNARYYDVLRDNIDRIKKSFMFFANIILPDNQGRNEIIVSNLLYNILYAYITDLNSSIYVDSKNQNLEDYIDEFVGIDEFNNLFNSMALIIQFCKKGVTVPEVVYSLINHIIGVLKKFNLHNLENLALNKSISFKSEKSKSTVEKKEKIKAFSYGATAQTYLLEKNNLVIKAYNDKLRWTTIGHDDSFLIFSKELEILKKGCGPKLIAYNEELKIIKMEYCGESLYNNFELPKDWKEQVTEIFITMSNKNIFYPEFHIQNLLVLGGKITFIDFGLAKIIEGADNTENCNKFIHLLTLLKEKFSQISDKEERYQLYSAFVENMKINNQQHH